MESCQRFPEVVCNAMKSTRCKLVWMLINKSRLRILSWWQIGGVPFPKVGGECMLTDGTDGRCVSNAHTKTKALPSEAASARYFCCPNAICLFPLWHLAGILKATAGYRCLTGVAVPRG